jgi:predicted N-acetyltransferase YhbS
VITIRPERTADVAAREALLDLAYGSARFRKPSQSLRAGRKPAAGMSLVAVEDGQIIGTVRLWEVAAGPVRALLLGPLAVHPNCRQRGIGGALMRRALSEASKRGHRAMLLVGDTAYYGRFGFSAAGTGALWLPGLDAPHRLLGCALAPGALDGVRGVIRAPERKGRTAAADAHPPLPAPQAA